MPERPPIGVIGVGWVGLVTGACFAELGHDVWLRDIDARKIESLRAGDVPIFEPGLADLVTRNLERLHFGLEVAPLMEHARLLFVCVDTPPTYSGDADLSRVEAVIEELPASSEHAIVMKSTVPVGTGSNVARRMSELGKPDFGYASNPEFLKEGSAVADFMNPDRVVVGSDPRWPWAADAVARLYDPLDCPVVRTDVASAEMIKLASNAFLATKISFINEIANVCEEVGADVKEVASGMGLDPRIGGSFLNAGVGFGGSCLVGDETVLVRRDARTWLTTLETLYEELEQDRRDDGTYSSPLEVLSWGAEGAQFLRVDGVTRREFGGEVVEVRTKMGRRVRTTPDHPFVVGDGSGGEARVELAGALTTEDWLPVAQNAAAAVSRVPETVSTVAGIASAGLTEADVIVRPRPSELDELASRGSLRLEELPHPRLSLDGSSMGTARNGTYVPVELEADERFWRVVGLYIAEGHRGSDGSRRRLQWSFHPTAENDLVEEVAGFWRERGVKVDVRHGATSTSVVPSSRILAHWWTDVLGLGSDCYTQRIPDLAWKLPASHKRALLSGMWHGDGSWSYVAGGPSLVLEYGTVSRDLADGTLRLLGDLGVMARLKVGRTAKSTTDTYWLVIAGADQVDRLLEFVPTSQQADIAASIAAQAKRIAPTGYRRDESDTAWVRVARTSRTPYKGFVYSLEVPPAHTFVTTGGLVVHNCFPKDVSALKQLAGNSGYHFQLLTAVIEVNELQKRRVVSKLKKHLGPLVGRRVGLLGLAFKPNTDDMREASSVVLAARLQGEGAIVKAYDPVAEERAQEMLTGVEMCDTALDAVDGVDAAVIVTEWPEFADIDLEELKRRMANPVIVDGRNMLNAEDVRRAGFVYEGIGRIPSAASD